MGEAEASERGARPTGEDTNSAAAPRTARGAGEAIMGECADRARPRAGVVGSGDRGPPGLGEPAGLGEPTSLGERGERDCGGEGGADMADRTGKEGRGLLPVASSPG